MNRRMAIRLRDGESTGQSPDHGSTSNPAFDTKKASRHTSSKDEAAPLNATDEIAACDSRASQTKECDEQHLQGTNRVDTKLERDEKSSAEISRQQTLKARIEMYQTLFNKLQIASPEEAQMIFRKLRDTSNSRGLEAIVEDIVNDLATE